MRLDYDLNNPVRRYTLPDAYIEISGIWHLPANNTLAFVQDEALAVHELHLDSGAVSQHGTLAALDAEDIVILDDTAFILVAGDKPAIYRIPGYAQANTQADRFDLALDAAYDPEGLTYDSATGQLLVACKGSPTPNDPLRQVYHFDPVSGRRSQSPVLIIDSRDFLDTTEDIFHPSGIAIHPRTGDRYVIGSREIKLLIRYDRQGRFLGTDKLVKRHFRQPEGIAFAANGDLFISTEGKKGDPAYVYHFKAGQQLGWRTRLMHKLSGLLPI